MGSESIYLSPLTVLVFDQLAVRVPRMEIRYRLLQEKVVQQLRTCLHQLFQSHRSIPFNPYQLPKQLFKASGLQTLEKKCSQFLKLIECDWPLFSVSKTFSFQNYSETNLQNHPKFSLQLLLLATACLTMAATVCWRCLRAETKTAVHRIIKVFQQ